MNPAIKYISAVLMLALLCDCTHCFSAENNNGYMRAYFAQAESVRKVDVCSHSVEVISSPEDSSESDSFHSRQTKSLRLAVDYDKQEFRYVIRTKTLVGSLQSNAKPKYARHTTVACYTKGTAMYRDFSHKDAAQYRDTSFLAALGKHTVPYLNAAGAATIYFNPDRPMEAQIDEYAHHFDDFGEIARDPKTPQLFKDFTDSVAPKLTVSIMFDAARMVPLRVSSNVDSNRNEHLNRTMEYQDKDGFQALLKETVSALMPQEADGKVVMRDCNLATNYEWISVNEDLDFIDPAQLVVNEEAALKYLRLDSDAAAMVVEQSQ